jgi:uncharacterized alkaline shock family protein YloU
MSVLDRVLITLLAVLGILVAVSMATVAMGWDASSTVTEIVHTMLRTPWETALAAFALFLTALHVLATSLSRRTEHAIVRETSLGQVRVSLRAVENAVYRSVQQLKGVRDVDVTVRASAQGVDVRISLAVAPDQVIPDISAEVQQRVERYILETVGVPVGTVTVEVKAVTVETRARVE